MLPLPLLLLCAAQADDLQWKAAPGEGVEVVVGDDDFRFQLRGRAQLRADVTGSEDDDGSGNDVDVGFHVRRLRAVFAGDVLQKRFAWNVQLAFSPRDLESDNPIIVRDANLSWNAHELFNVRFGQMKVPFDRQRVTSSGDLQFPERSEVVNELTLDRDVGVVFFSKPIADAFQYQVGVFGGDGRNRLNTGTGLLYTARGQWFPLGAFEDDHVEGDPDRDDDARLAFGLAAGFNQLTPRQRSTTGDFHPDARVDNAHLTADVLFKKSGFSVLVAGLGRVASGVDVADGVDSGVGRSAVGAVAQVGFMVTDHVEIVGRAGHIEPLVGVSVVENEADLVRQEELRAGVNVYFLGHDVKLSNDVGIIAAAGAPVVVEGHVMAQIAY